MLKWLRKEEEVKEEEEKLNKFMDSLLEVVSNAEVIEEWIRSREWTKAK